jgi:hypothetical protein
VFGVPMSPGQLVNRMGMYGKDIWGKTVNWLRNKFRRKTGQVEERRVLDTPEESCSMCPDLAAQGWGPVGRLPAIGDTPCGPGCKCHFEFRDV